MSDAQRILIVDDEEQILNLLKRRLEKRGYEIDTAINGQEAIPLLKNQNYSLMICDVNMPIMNGFELLEYCKTNEIQYKPMIYFTGHAEGTPEMDEAMKKDVDGVFSKTLSFKDLLKELQKLITD